MASREARERAIKHAAHVVRNGGAWTRRATMDSKVPPRRAFDEWADELSPGARILLLHEVVELVAQERDDMKTLLIARGETDESISAELDLIEAGRGASPRLDQTKEDR